MKRSRLLAAALTTALTACAVGPHFQRPTPPDATGFGTGSPDAGATIGGAGAEAQRFVGAMDIPSQWWTLFRSPDLNRLVEQALTANPNVAAAQAALRDRKSVV